jgi:uncharacterized membrane protein
VNGQVINFNHNAIRPVECFSAGWQLIKNEYWLFLGLSFVAIVIGSVAPFAILLGPMMCGLHMCLLAKMRNEPVSFNLLFKGFDFFGPSLIATLIQVVPIFAVVIVSYVVFIVFFLAAGAAGAAGGEGAAAGVAVFGIIIFVLVVVALALAVGLAFIFIYPLIVDHKLSGFDACKTSAKAVMANFGGALGLMLMQALVGLVGALACYVGAFFVMPIGFAATAVAYRQVFPPGQQAPPQHYAPPPQYPDYGGYYQQPPP